MHLKKLQLVGFKSFAEKTTLSFERGITAIVGPNGCGKSNIADAFRWVLGEQSAKSMRGTKMPDVIFAGASGRPPLNYAEASITLTEIEGALPIEYEEITITRRLHRSGESEYLLNNQPIRLKDLQSLFLDSGIGKDSFSIFEQGKIDQVINYSPIERRYIFEEAAGILRFLQRKRETMRKLEQVDGNISRVKDIHREVEKQVIVLREQAEKAQEFKQLKSHIERQEKELLVAKTRQIEKRKAEALAQAAEMTKMLTGLSEIIQALEEQRAAAKSELEAIEKQMKQQSEALFQIRSDKNIKSREKSHAQEQLKAASAKEKRWQLELETIYEQRQHRQNEQAKLKKQLLVSQADASTLEACLQEQREQVLKLETEVNKLQQAQRKAQQELLTAHQHESRFDGELKQHRVRLENSHERQRQLLERQARLQELEQEFKQQFDEKEKRVKDGLTAIDRQRAVLEALEVKVQEVVSEISAHQSARDATLKELNQQRARLEALMRLRSDLEGFSGASKRLLKESSSLESPLYGKLRGLYELILPQEAAAGAVASVLGRYSETLVVESKADAEAVWDFASQHDLNDFSLIVLELLPIRHQPNLSKPTIKHESLAFQVAHAEVAQHLLSDVFVAEDRRVAQNLLDTGLQGEFWCNDRMFIDRRGVFFFGVQAKNNAFMREAEIKSLEGQVEELASTRQKQESLLTASHQKKAQLHAEMVELDKSIRRREMEQVEATFALQRLGADLEKNKKEAANAEAELQLLIQAIEKLQAVLHELEKQLESASAITLKFKSEVSAIEAEAQQKSLVLKEQKQRLHEVDSSCHGAAELVRQSQQAMQVIEIKENESVRHERRIEEEIQMSSQFQSQLQQKSQECDQALEVIELQLQQTMAACQGTEQTIAKQKSFISDMEKSIADNLQGGKKQETEQHQIELLIAQLEAASKSFETELQERYGLSMAEAQEEIGQIDRSIDSMERKLRELRKKSEASGDINMTAIDECQRHQVRFDFLNQQITDLDTSKEELLLIIKELETESRKLFKETFALISANFKKNFAILFNGGEADLQFTETSDLLEAGIEIIAKPPGKQMRSISLLSGGEKCLTAMALLFAIFEVKAGPFCILDEIDAPLDDSNVERFANVVKQFIDRCQFIIITHNKQTMAIADRLFGVSMQEKGISKLLQMELAQAEAAV